MRKPPSNNKSKTKPMTAKRQKILERAMAQLNKTRAQIDPKVLGKIRSIIASNPKVMKGLGLNEMPAERGNKEPVEKKSSIVTEKKLAQDTVFERSKAEPAIEKIDPAHNQEVIAKLMQLKPTEIENIKAVLLKDKS